MIHRLASGAALAALCAGGSLAAPAALTPIPVASLATKLSPGYHHVFSPETANPLAREARANALAAGTVNTVPTWIRSFTINGKTYHAHIIGTAPGVGGATIVPVVIVPIRLTISDYRVGGAPLVLDGDQVVTSMLASPFFNASSYPGGARPFIDAMLHADFPTAKPTWSVTFAPTVASTLNITAPSKTATVYKAASGAYLATINSDNVIDTPITKALASYPANTVVIFVTYNAMEHDAFGYHDFYMKSNSGGDVVYTYTSWLVGVDDAFSVPSPDATTLAHELAELTYDPLITSLTLRWGDAFDNNKCFQSYIEVGDAVEDAPASVQLYKEHVTVGGVTNAYTLQNEALLAWFERLTPSPAIGGAYSFPSATALTTAAPLTCK
jgi:hypothetical protein